MNPGASDSGSSLAELAPEDQRLVDSLRKAFELRGSEPQARRDDRYDARATSDAEMLSPGNRLGDFEIVGELGRGGMGVVYRARQMSLGREVALKVLPARVRNRRMAVQRFRTEAEAAARTHHTNVVSVYAQGQDAGHWYYAMELIDGVGLDTVIHSRPDLLSSTRLRDASSSGWALKPGPDPAVAAASDESGTTAGPARPRPAWTRADYRHLAALMAEVADALDCAHQQGVIHRDVKPHNLLLGQDQRLHLTDFGLARLTDEPHLTVSGEIMGTPAYLSPEQLRGDADGIDHRTDVYSLGVTLYELLTRRRPFDGDSREQIIAAVLTTEPPVPRRVSPTVPVDLETICVRAMDKDPQRRHAAAALLAEDLRRFADGRPILSRRTSRVAKAVKWARRHRAATTALVAAVVVGALVVGWVWSVRAHQRAEATRLLCDAYEQLAYFDYRAGDGVAAEVDRAAALGADRTEVRIVQALAGMGGADWVGAIEHVRAALADDPHDQRARYLLAWAQRENRELAAARATFEQAEQQGPPTTADAWFLRGLAIHYDQPAVAIESYRQANALRAQDHAFYPQAMLHLARAQNQQLYITRSLEPLPEADASLRQLIEHGHYGAQPYYLLSIAHRLAAEIYSGSLGTRDDSLVSEHYAQALTYAQGGQAVDPSTDRPITAEAECLESMGRYEEAIAARTRAITAAANEYARCEGHHYRWRLRYWTGDLEGALQDVAVHAGCDPQSRFYAHVYPALLLAEMGDLDGALGHARTLADEEPGGAVAVVWSATCLRLLGAADEAEILLAERADAVSFAAGLVPPQTEEWIRALYALAQGQQSPEELEALASASSAPWKLWGEAYFHAAARHLAQGDREQALELVERAYRSFDNEERYTYHAKLILNKMRPDSAWPPWIDVSWNHAADAPLDVGAERPANPRRSGEGEEQ